MSISFNSEAYYLLFLTVTPILALVVDWHTENQGVYFKQNQSLHYFDTNLPFFCF